MGVIPSDQIRGRRYLLRAKYQSGDSPLQTKGLYSTPTKSSQPVGATRRAKRYGSTVDIVRVTRYNAYSAVRISILGMRIASKRWGSIYLKRPGPRPASSISGASPDPMRLSTLWGSPPIGWRYYRIVRLYSRACVGKVRSGSSHIWPTCGHYRKDWGR